LPQHTDGSIVFTRWHQWAPHVTYGFLCGWTIGVEFAARLPKRPVRWHRHFLQAPKYVSVWGVLIHHTVH